MPQIPLNLLKQKIIKTDTVIRLLAEKNAKILQLREKLKMLYHKYMNSSKECEELQLKADLCKMEHDPLVSNLQEITQRYRDLQENYELLTNSSEIRYQNKCKELELETRRYDELQQQKEQCNSCQEMKGKYDNINKKYDRINKELYDLNEEYEKSQRGLKNLQTIYDQMERNYFNQLKTVEDYTNEIARLQTVVKSLKLSESNLHGEIAVMNGPFELSKNIKQGECFDIFQRIDVVNEDCQWNVIEYILKSERVPPLLSPILSPIGENGKYEVDDNKYIPIGCSLEDEIVKNKTMENICISDASINSIDCSRPDELNTLREHPLSFNESQDSTTCTDNSQDVELFELIGTDTPAAPSNHSAGKICQNIENGKDPTSCDNVWSQTHQETVDKVNISKQDNAKSDDLSEDDCIHDNFISENYDEIQPTETSLDNESNNGDKSSDTDSAIHDIILKTHNCSNGTNVLQLESDAESNQKEIKSQLVVKSLIQCYSMSSSSTSTDKRQGCTDSNILLQKEIYKDSSAQYTIILDVIKKHKTRSAKYIPQYSPNDDFLGFLQAADVPLVNEWKTNEESIEHPKDKSSTAPIISNPKSDTSIHSDEISDKSSMVSESIQTEIVKSSHISDNEREYVNIVYTSLLNKILSDHHESIQYHPKTVGNSDFLGFRKKIDSDTKVRIPVRRVRRKVGWGKIKADIFHSLVKYINKRMNLSQYNLKTSKGVKRIKRHSSRFRVVRKMQMLRWKKLRELYLSSTDTDSDQSKNALLYRKRKGCKAQSNEKPPSSICEISSDISEDEYTFRKIMREERVYRTLFSNHKELEEFYYSSIHNSKLDEVTLTNNKANLELNSSRTDSGKATEINTTPSNTDGDDKDGANSDSGYVKSDSDENMKVMNKRKRTIHDYIDSNSIRSTKRKLNCSSSPIDIVKKRNVKMVNDYKLRSQGKIRDIELSKSTTVIPQVASVQDVNGDSHARDGADIEEGNKEYDTSERINILLDCNSIMGGATTLRNNASDNNQRLFGTDTSNLLSNDEDAVGSVCSLKRRFKLRTTKPNNTLKQKTQNSTTSKTIKDNNTGIVKSANSANTPIERLPAAKPRNNTTKTTKRLKSKIRELSPVNAVAENLHVESESDGKDPLHARLQQDDFQDPVNIKNRDAAARIFFKRSNSLKARQALAQTTANSKLNNTTTAKDLIHSFNKKPTKLYKEKAKALLKQILTFPDKSSIVEEAVVSFATQDKTYISRIIISELLLDMNKADTKYTPPAPVLTDTQRILLGFLTKLDESALPGVLDTFLAEAEKYLLTSKKLQYIENIARLYLAVCKLQRNTCRMRRMVCDAFYFMGDLSIPFLFTVLSTWIETLPLESDVQSDSIVKVIIEIVKQKHCLPAGYNLQPLKGLLKNYYGYNTEESSIDDVFVEVLQKYAEKQCKSTEYAIRILCKHTGRTWVTQKIERMTSLDTNKDNILKLIQSIYKNKVSGD